MSRRARILAVGLSIFLAVACLSTLGYVKYLRLSNHVTSLRGHLNGLEAMTEGELLSAAQTGNLANFRAELRGAKEGLKGMKAELGPLLGFSRFLGWLPVVGGDIAAAPDLLEIGIGITTAGDLLFEGMAPVFSMMTETTEAESATGTTEAMTVAIVEGQPYFQLAHNEMQEAQALWGGLSAETLSPRVASLLNKLDSYLPLLDRGVEALVMAPSLLGADKPRAYLLLAQNEHELRATGGFVSSVALLRISEGRILGLDFRDSYAVDDLSQPHPAAPKPLEEHMLAEIWLLRDANWYPDFPTSAEVARELFQLDQGVSVDGVIAADLTAIQLLMGAMEPLELNGYEEEVTSANVLDLMQRYWASPGGAGQTEDWWQHRKDFMGDLLSAMMDKTQREASSIDLGQLLRALQRCLEERHILVYMVDPQLGAALRESGWDGGLRSVEGDYLMVVDTNMGFNKVNATVRTSVDYHFTIEDWERVSGTLSVTYDNPSRVEVQQCVQEAAYPPTYREMMEGCYWDYLRAYTPANSQLMESPELTLPQGSLRARATGAGGARLPTAVGPSEVGNNVFASFFVVAPGERREMIYHYQLPSTVLLEEEGETKYRLFVQKQPGTLAVPLRVEVQPPSGSAVVSTTPTADSSTDGLVVFSTDLRVDRQFEVVFR